MSLVERSQLARRRYLSDRPKCTRGWSVLTLFALVAALSSPFRAPANASEGSPSVLAGLEMRGIGPALMSGRVADIEIHPQSTSTWYVAVGSGGVWKTINRGTSWTPLFDDQPSYSIGEITLDPQNPDVIWVGTGENVSGRHVGFGDGVYRSLDGGSSWEQVGLAESEHIGRIIVHPEDSNTVWVAAEGPLWSAGGERGVYKTTDGGASWRAVLVVDENTGATDLEIDPRDPEVLYAATFERRRHVWSYLAGGPGSGIYKSTDGGETWRELDNGLPQGDAVGKIGLAISPVDPDVVYATIEAREEERGFYRSLDRGESWEFRNGYLSNGTGPHYYQEIEASPHDRDTVYQMDVFMRLTRDGGATFVPVGEPDKHSDNHALAFDPNDPEFLLSGNDGGIYESYDSGGTWRYVHNLPVTQIYKLAVDEETPFYNVVIGTQDNGTQAGPSRTDNLHGIRNRNWYVPYGADGYDCAVDPRDPTVLYVTWQNGHLLRYDRDTAEALDIRPQAAPGEDPERWNWDAPIEISPHDPDVLWFGSQRVWRSTDRGNSWTAVSGDLSHGTERYEMPMGERVRSVDALYDNGAMSWYGNLTSLSESPVTAGVVWAGTDDGRVHVTEDSGETWRAVELPGVPERAFVNEVKASLHDAKVARVLLDDHKHGDFAPYLFETRDGGQTWTSIRGDLPNRHLVWSLVEDHVDPLLLFLGTEFGVYVTQDGGDAWHLLDRGIPTIAIRDLEIQRRESDLVAGSFGRGVFILDDYSPLRVLEIASPSEEAGVLPVRDAWWYNPALRLGVAGRGMLGSNLFTAPNPPHGATVRYWLPEAEPTGKKARRKGEKALAEEGADVPFPGWEVLAAEDLDESTRLAKTVLEISSADGKPVRRLSGPAEAGLHTVTWDLRRSPGEALSIEEAGDLPPWVTPPRGPLVVPGTYSVRLTRVADNGTLETVGESQSFEVVAPPGRAAERGQAYAASEGFHLETLALTRRANAAALRTEALGDRIAHLKAAFLGTPGAPDNLLASLLRRERERLAADEVLYGGGPRARLLEPTRLSIQGAVYTITEGVWGTTGGPTNTHRELQAEALRQLSEVEATYERIVAEVERVAQALDDLGARPTPPGP